jgi:hypothetical protein
MNWFVNMTHFSPGKKAPEDRFVTAFNGGMNQHTLENTT